MDVVTNTFNKTHQKRVVWILSDGLVGHYHQSLGVLSALAHIYPIEKYWVEVRLRHQFLRPLLGLLLNLKGGVLPLSWFKFFYEGDLPDEMPHFVIGTGGKVLFAVAWLGTVFQAKNIICGNAHRLSANLFSAILVENTSMPYLPKHEAYIGLDLMPSPYEEKQQSMRTVPNHDFPLWGMCIGGNAKADARYTSSDWNMLANEMNALYQRAGVRWLFTTSRRTGQTGEVILSQVIQQSAVYRSCWWSSDPVGREDMMPFILKNSDVVVVTVDSESMIQEAISARKKVIIVRPKHYRMSQNFWQMIQMHIKQQHCLLVDIRELSELIHHLDKIIPIQFSPQEELIHKLMEHSLLHLHLR